MTTAAHRPRTTRLFALAALLAPTLLAGQELKLAVGDVGLGIGPVPRLDGLRMNFRDDGRLERVRGVNLTIWAPHDDVRGSVEGLALGVPLTGAYDLSGLAVGASVTVMHEFRGLGIAPIGMGAGSDLRGIVLAGIGAGAGGEVSGIVLSGIGVGAGGGISGLIAAGIGAGTGGDLTGIGFGGVGLGAGGAITGLAVGGVGVGAGGSIRGITLSLGGVGAGGDLVGLSLAGLGAGAGGEIRGLAFGGLGVGAPEITGVAASLLAAGGERIRGLVLAPAYFRLIEDGEMHGVSVSAFNDIRGAQFGLAIGLLNITEELHGFQVGLVNIARNKEHFSFLPLVNYHP